MKTLLDKNRVFPMLLSALTVLSGSVLLIYMIVVEDEPGAIPLLLIGAGMSWYFYTRFRTQSNRQ